MPRIPIAAAIAIALPALAAAQSVEVAPPRIITLGDEATQAPRTVTIHRGRARQDTDWKGVSGAVAADPGCLPGAAPLYPELPDIAGGTGIALEP
jgi:hypothetical protein